jgi:predicted lipoprotein with Yx(FWY)xxD motif
MTSSRTRRLTVLAVSVAALAVAGTAIAASAPTLQIGKAKVRGQTKNVVVQIQGLTLYTLSDERVGNLKCLNNACFSIWPPYKVPASGALTKAPGISGTLARLKRVRGGFYQLMLNGRPLYRYNGDSSKGQANGQGIRSYGGTWSVVTP